MYKGIGVAMEVKEFLLLMQNSIVKVSEGTGDWGFNAKLSDNAGKRINGIEFLLPDFTPLVTEYDEQIYSTTVDYEDFEDNNFSPQDTDLYWWSWNHSIYYSTSFSDIGSPVHSVEKAHSGSYSMKLEYNKQFGDNYLGGWIEENASRRDFSNYNTIVIWIYGKADILIALHTNVNGNEIIRNIGIKTVENTDKWSKLEFDYSNLKNDNSFDLKDVHNILIGINPGDNQSEGIIYIDDISLISK